VSEGRQPLDWLLWPKRSAGRLDLGRAMQAFGVVLIVAGAFLAMSAGGRLLSWTVRVAEVVFIARHAPTRQDLRFRVVDDSGRAVVVTERIGAVVASTLGDAATVAVLCPEDLARCRTRAADLDLLTIAGLLLVLPGVTAVGIATRALRRRRAAGA
jgi:hypothetical protein